MMARSPAGAGEAVLSVRVVLDDLLHVDVGGSSSAAAGAGRGRPCVVGDRRVGCE